MFYTKEALDLSVFELLFSGIFLLFVKIVISKCYASEKLCPSYLNKNINAQLHVNVCSCIFPVIIIKGMLITK